MMMLMAAARKDRSRGVTQISIMEQKALELIKKRGEQGVPQSELWKLLGIDSRDGSRIALRLLKKGLITREPITYNGKKTYVLYYVQPRAPRVLISIDSIRDIPCFRCPYVSRCGPGNFYNPETCVYLSQWLRDNPDP